MLRIRLRVQSFFDPWIRDPRWKKFGAIIPRAEKQFFGLQILNSLLRIRDAVPFLTLDPGPGMENFGTGLTSRFRNTASDLQVKTKHVRNR